MTFEAMPFIEMVGTMMYYIAAFFVALLALFAVAFVLLVVFGFLKSLIVYLIELRYPPIVRETRREERERRRKEAMVLRGMLGN